MIPLGGFLDAGGVGLWGILAPLGALVFSDVRSAVRWYVAWVVVFLGSGIAGELLGGVSPTVPEWFTSTMLALNITVGGTIVFTLLAAFAGAAPRRARRAASGAGAGREPAAQRPASLDRGAAEEQPEADRRRVRRGVDPVRGHRRLHPDARLACRPTSSSACSTRCSPSSTRWSTDDLEKIKTIGDCYMVAAGVPTPRPDHAQRARAARARHAARERRRRAHRLPLRIGINSGPVVAGVIGRKRFLYDLWGDAVNIASRMESPGTAGRIQITRATYELLRGRVRLRAARHGGGQGQGRHGDLVPDRPPGASRRRVAADIAHPIRRREVRAVSGNPCLVCPLRRSGRGHSPTDHTGGGAFGN